MFLNYYHNRRIQRIEKIVNNFRNASNVSENEKQKTEHSKKKEKKIIVICSSFLSLVLVAAIIAAVITNHYLSKINYGDVTGAVDENLDEEEEIDFDIAESKEISQGPADSENSNVKKVISKEDDYNNLNSNAEIQKKANDDIDKNINSDGIWQSDDVYNLLLIGYDAGDAEAVMFEGATLPRSDAIIIISVNKVKDTVKMVSLSRATYVAIPDHGNKRINTAHAYGGAKTLVDTIELNYKIKIDRYVSSDFNGFKAIVDALGGVTIDMTSTEADFAFNSEDKEAGTYTMNGTQALRYVRLRKTDSDRMRTGRQRKVLKAITQQAGDMDISEKLDFLDAVLPYVTTNFSKSELISKANELQTYLSWKMTQDIIPHNATELTMRDGKEVLILDWEETTEYIHSILYSGVSVKKY
jgi:LCP family protein required for cell wall assembly